MNGIHYILDTYSINKTNATLAAQKVLELSLSLNTIKHFLAETITLGAEELIPILPMIDNAMQAKMLLSAIVRIGLQKKLDKVSMVVFNECHEWIKTNPVQPERIEPTVVRMITPIVASVVPSKVITVKATRNRKVSTTSNLSRAKALFSNASNKSRDSIVSLFQKELGIESGTATTYYYLAKKA